jgi:hypothetical protein
MIEFIAGLLAGFAVTAIISGLWDLARNGPVPSEGGHLVIEDEANVQ